MTLFDTIQSIKMDRFLIVLFFMNVLFFPPICRASEVKKYNEAQGQVLREALQQILKFDLPEVGRNLSKVYGHDDSGNGKLNSGKEKIKNAPKLPLHMIELYEKYTFENIASGETIRSIEPSKDFVPHFKDILVFNVSSVQDVRADKLRTAHFHMHRRGGAGLGIRKTPDGKLSRGRTLPPPCRVRLYQIIGGSSSPQPDIHPVVPDGAKELGDIERMKLRNLDSIPVPQVTRGGWYSIEISMALKEMLNSPAGASSFIFGVRFEGPRGKSISPQHFLKEPGNNSSSTFIVTFSDDSLDPGSEEKEKLKLSPNQIDIMNELLEHAASSEISIAEKRNKKDAHINSDPSSYSKEMPSFESHDKSRHMKRKLKKMETAFAEITPKESIRHGKKYRNRHSQDSDENKLNLNDADYTENSDSDSNKLTHKESVRHQKSPPVPGSGDISELLDYDRVKKIRALRRHNHKKINSINVRYDTVTKSVIQKKLGKWGDEDLSQELNEPERNEERMAGLKSYDIADERHMHRFIRSVHDNDVPDYVLEFAGSSDNKDGEETSTEGEFPSDDDVQAEKVYFKNDQNKIVSKLETKEKEYAKEDDMGDLSYYEPDVYMHENLIPSSHRQNYDSQSINSYEYAKDSNTKRVYHDEIETNEVLKHDDNFHKNSKSENEKDDHIKKPVTKINNIDPATSDNLSEFSSSENSKKYSKATQTSDEKSSSISADDTLVSSVSEKRRHKNQKRKPRKQRSKKNSAKKNNLSRDPKSWDQVNESDIDDSCRKAKLTVRFADIGWGDWIIAPEYFDAGFCSGKCLFPYSQAMDVTNHAIVQSLVRNLNQPKIPNPCCVPSELAPATVLYIDNASHVVLKNYKNMQVRRCGCR